MGVYDDHTWTEKEDLSDMSKLKFPKEVFIEFFKELMELAETEGL